MKYSLSNPFLWNMWIVYWELWGILVSETNPSSILVYIEIV